MFIKLYEGQLQFSVLQLPHPCTCHRANLTVLFSPIRVELPNSANFFCRKGGSRVSMTQLPPHFLS